MWSAQEDYMFDFLRRRGAHIELIPVMTISATSGRFYVDERDIERIKNSPNGMRWQIAVDGFIDPGYGSTQLVIKEYDKARNTLRGTLTIGESIRNFVGSLEKADPVYRKGLQCNWGLTG